MDFSFGGGPIPFWGWFVLVVSFWAFCPACGVRLAGQVRVSARQSESSRWASLRSM
jgi:hypothetical protein